MLTNKQIKSRAYLTKAGFIKPSDMQKQSTYKRTEGNVRYEYGNATANAFSGWQSIQRDNAKDTSFTSFYEQLQDQYKEVITVINL